MANGRPAGIDIRFPGMHVWAVQRAPGAAALRTNPRYGDWLDVYCTISRPLLAPVAGLLAASYPPHSHLVAADATAASAASTASVTVAAVGVI